MTSSKLRALLILACAALCAGLLAACGDSEEQAASAAPSVLQETLAATSKIDSGRLTGRLRLEPDGLLALGGPIVLSASGPFAAPAAGAGPRFDIAVAATLGASPLRARASSTGKRAYLRLGGRDYVLGEYGSHASKRRSVKPRDALAALGLDPAAWVKDPQEHGGAMIGDVETVRITGDLDVARVLADVARLLDGGGAGGLLTPKLRAQLADGVKTAKVEIWTGANDRILRQLTAFVDFTFKQGAQPIPGLDGGRINLRLRLDDVNTTTFHVATPKNARPLSSLFGDGDGGLGALLSALGQGFAPRTSGGDAGQAFMRCVKAAGEDSAKVMACASKLTP